MWPNPHADLVTFIGEIFHGKLHFLCSGTFSFFSISKRLCILNRNTIYVSVSSDRLNLNFAWIFSTDKKKLWSGENIYHWRFRSATRTCFNLNSIDYDGKVNNSYFQFYFCFQFYLIFIMCIFINQKHINFLNF